MAFISGLCVFRPRGLSLAAAGRLPRFALLNCVLAVSSLLISFPVWADGDPERGERIFNRCRSCHEVIRERNRNGPHLVGLFGRLSGSVEGFRYSKAMAKAGIVWSEETLDGYLENPRAYLKGTRMAFSGLRDGQDREDLIEYLKQITVVD